MFPLCFALKFTIIPVFSLIRKVFSRLTLRLFLLIGFKQAKSSVRLSTNFIWSENQVITPEMGVIILQWTAKLCEQNLWTKGCDECCDGCSQFIVFFQIRLSNIGLLYDCMTACIVVLFLLMLNSKVQAQVRFIVSNHCRNQQITAELTQLFLLRDWGFH